MVTRDTCQEDRGGLPVHRGVRDLHGEDDGK